MRLRLPDDRSDPAIRWSRDLRCRQMHRLPLLRSGRALGACRPRNGTRSLPRFRSVRTAPTAPISPLPLARNGQALTDEESKRYRENIVKPACVKACPADALRFGTRDDMLQEARNRISDQPDKYVDHIYGEKEAGGTSVLYLSSVPFDEARFSRRWQQGVSGGFPAWLFTLFPPAVLAVGALLGGTYAFLKRRAVRDGEWAMVQHHTG